MTTDLQVVPEPPEANKRILSMLRDLLKKARAGDIQSIGFVYLDDGEMQVDYEAEDGHELTLASLARQLDQVIRDDLFSGE